MDTPVPLASQLRPPRQKRSQATLDRILVAAEELLRTRLLEEITLGDILAKSSVSVGAFYTRFPNKDALIPCLYDRYDRRLAQAASRVLEIQRWAGRPLPWRLRLLFRYVVRAYRLNRGLMRALTLKVRMDPDVASPTHREHRADLYAAATAVLLECRDEIVHPDPEQAVRFALLLAGCAFRERILYDRSPQAGSVRLDDRRLADETALAVAAYLTCPRGTT
jgi:AcrR family transcriptional regulator